MKIKIILIVGLALCLTASVALANVTVVGTSGYGFQSFTTGDLSSARLLVTPTGTTALGTMGTEILGTF